MCANFGELRLLGRARIVKLGALHPKCHHPDLLEFWIFGWLKKKITFCTKKMRPQTPKIPAAACCCARTHRQTRTTHTSTSRAAHCSPHPFFPTLSSRKRPVFTVLPAPTRSNSAIPPAHFLDGVLFQYFTERC